MASRKHVNDDRECAKAVDKLREELHEVYLANVLKRDLHAASAEVFQKAADNAVQDGHKLSATASTSPHPAVAREAAKTSADSFAKADDLYAQADQFTHDAHAAHDVAQEALVRAVTRRLLFLGTGSVAGWMTRIAVNLAKNRRRDHQPHRRTACRPASALRGRRRGEVAVHSGKRSLVWPCSSR